MDAQVADHGVFTKTKQHADGTQSPVVVVYDNPDLITGVAGVPATSADASAADLAVSDAPGANLKAVLENLHISSGAAIALTFKEETSGAVVYGPVYMAANSTVTLKLPKGKKLATANKKIVVRASGAGAFSVLAGYRVEA
jgi:hypothetical protein